MSAADSNPIPVTVIGGFLGAGKTTYLNRLIGQGDLPANSLILVNDFGGVNIDAELIEYRDDRVMKLSNGCICCTLGGTLAEQLAQVLRMPEPVAAIYIEASGVSDPARIADIARVSRQLKLDDIVCVLDASQLHRNSADPLVKDVWHAQVRSATKLWLNRGTSADTEFLLHQLNPSVELIIDDRPPPAAANTQHLSSPRTVETSVARTKLATFSLILEAPVDQDWLAQLFEQYQDILVRAKGIVYTRPTHKAQVVHLSGDLLSWWPTKKAPTKGQLVCIGAEGARFEALKGVLKAC
ncbi:GTP-binding protein [Pontibacterium granulatum]|uniref:CobW family GTP-binding protein n=1 Tax=Pontibacterium granulatum TaxID=2036029 RepID=UPI00249AA7BC|nr:GTP-binding protein [Pontibacterium granulatum]MDI3324373.1 GTP-binding protein [Pontibacterium granulatum]